MAVTSVTRVLRTVIGNKRLTVTDVVAPASYTTNGDALTASDLGLQKVQSASLDPVTSGGYVPRYDRTNSKLLFFMGDNNNASDGPLIQVASTTDLSAQSVRITAIGY